MSSKKKSKPTSKSKEAPEKGTLDTMSEPWGNQWHDCLPLSEKELLEFEKRLRISIPRELKTLFLCCNGGWPEKTYFTNSHIEVEVGSLLPIQPPSFYIGESLEIVQEWLLSHGYSPEILPFAYDNGNAGVFCLDTGTGEINYWVQDESDGVMRKIATSLNDFLSNLCRPPY